MGYCGKIRFWLQGAYLWSLKVDWMRWCSDKWENTIWIVCAIVSGGAPLLPWSWARLNINTLRPRQNYRHFSDNIFKCIFVNENVWILIKISLRFFSYGCNGQYHSIGLHNGLVSNRRQVIIWTDADPIRWRIYAALGGDELILGKQFLFPPTAGQRQLNDYWRTSNIMTLLIIDGGHWGCTWLTHLPLDKMAPILADESLRYIFKEMIEFRFKCHWIMFPGV